MNVRRSFVIQLALLLATSAAALAQSADLAKVLKAMDQQAATFRGAQADFVWDQYTKKTGKTDQQNGNVFFHRVGKNGVRVNVEIKSRPEYALFTADTFKLNPDSSVKLVENGANQKEDNAANLLALGFGASGSDLTKWFDVKYAGTEKVADVMAAKLELTPKSLKARGVFAQVVLWIDPARGVSVQQKFTSPNGDCRLAKYTNLALNQSEESGTSSSLAKVLKAMDQQAATFRSAQADFVWDQYTKIVDDHDIQQGTIYFRRVDKDQLQMAADIKKPNSKYVLFGNGLVKIYDHVPGGIDQVTEYNAGKNKAAFETFLVLGFGGSGEDLQKSFDVKYSGMENVMGVNAAKLDLTPKSQKVQNMFNHIILWIDPARGISVQQQFITPDGDYRLAKYSNIVLNGKISDEVFKLKTTSKTTTVRPQG